MSTRYNIVVTATDAATARLKVIKQGVSGILAPITNIGKSVKALGKEAGVDKLASGIGKLTTVATGAIKSIGGIGGALAGVVGVGSLTALAAYTKEMVYSQSAIYRFSQVSGVAAQRVQVLEGAAKLAGLQAGDMDSAIMGLGNTLQDARWGRNQGALLMMNRLGIQLKTTKDGAIDTEASLGDLADLLGPGGKLANQPVQTKMLVAQQFGVEALLPILLKGRKALEDYERTAARLKPPVDSKEWDKARQSIDEMGASFDGLGQAIAIKALPGLEALSGWISRHNQQAAANVQKYGVFGAIAHGAGETAKDVVRAPYNKLKGNIDDIGNLIGAGEGGYNSVNTGQKGGYKSAHVNLVESSIASIMASQARGDFNAAGKYQITRDTLKMAVQAMHLDTSQKFDQGMQEKIFRDYLISKKRPEISDYLSGKSNDLGAAVKAASKEWASVADPDTGKSHYDGVGGNKASISSDQMAAALQAARSNPGPSEQGQRYVLGSGGGAGGKVSGEITVVVKAPAGTEAQVTKQSGPVKTTLKQDTSMPDFAL